MQNVGENGPFLRNIETYPGFKIKNLEVGQILIYLVLSLTINIPQRLWVTPMDDAWLNWESRGDQGLSNSGSS